MNYYNLIISGTTQARFCFSEKHCKIPMKNLAMNYNSFYGQKSLLESNMSCIGEGAIIVLTIQYPIYLCDHDGNKEVHLSSDSWVSDYETGLHRNLQGNSFTEKEIHERVSRLIQGWERETKPFSIISYTTEGHSAEMNQRLQRSIELHQRIIDYCLKKGWKPVLVGLPYCEELFTRVSDDFVRECFLKCANMLSEKNGIPFLDYSKDEEFESIQNYLDIWYLNLFGRTRFTNRLINDLRIMEGDI